MFKEYLETKPLYPFTEWEVVEEDFKVENNYRNETIFALANGYIGMRGNFEEGYSGPAGTGLEGTYINGFYESEIIKYGEIAYGFAEKSQTMLNVVNGKKIKLFIGDEEFDMLRGCVADYKRILNLKEGLLKRSLQWTSSEGRMVRIDIERMVSFENKNLAAISYKVTPLNFEAKIRLTSILDGDVKNLTVDNDPRVGSGLHGRVLSVESISANGTFASITQKTQNTGFTLTCSMENQLVTENPFNRRESKEALQVSIEYEIDAKKGMDITLNKYLAYVTCREYDVKRHLQVSESIVKAAKGEGFERLKESQKLFMEGFWSRSDVQIKGDAALQQGIRVNMFHLLQSVGRDGKTNIAAKGLTGEGYEGHYFWDTEIYVLPFFLYNKPEISRKLLEHRYSILDKARERARQMSHKKGALFPWRTIGGEECSAYFPAGTAQYHINADIAYALKKYMEATMDEEFLQNYGAEILFETARLWADLGDFIESKGNQFCINCVTGPDEYTAIVNNNCYTNLMARENLNYAYETACWMKQKAADKYAELARRIGLEDSEPDFWKKAADNMYIPYNEERSIYPQDDSFLDKARWDFENTPADQYPLLLHFHPLVIYRYQVCKQADLILALLLLGNRFTQEEKKRNYDFYEEITTHDSSLSTCIFSIMASETGYRDKAYKYFMSTARMDLDDYHGNSKNGIHVANMAGTWMGIVYGFAGMRAYEGVLGFHPYLPESWEEYAFKVTFKGRLIGVRVDKAGAHYELLEGEEISINNDGQKLVLTQK